MVARHGCRSHITLVHRMPQLNITCRSCTSSIMLNAHATCGTCCPPACSRWPVSRCSIKHHNQNTEPVGYACSTLDARRRRLGTLQACSGAHHGPDVKHQDGCTVTRNDRQTWAHDRRLRAPGLLSHMLCMMPAILLRRVDQCAT